MAHYYVKATYFGGVSVRDPDVAYHVGDILTHPNPDRRNAACGRGYHVASTIMAAQDNLPKAREYYLCQVDDILGEDAEGGIVRAAVISILWRIPQEMAVACIRQVRLLDESYIEQAGLFDANYWAWRYPMEDPYWGLLKPLCEAYRAQRKRLDKGAMQQIVEAWESALPSVPRGI